MIEIKVSRFSQFGEIVDDWRVSGKLSKAQRDLAKKISEKYTFEPFIGYHFSGIRKDFLPKIENIKIENIKMREPKFDLTRETGVIFFKK
jgi:hypothetical protein